MIIRWEALAARCSSPQPSDMRKDPASVPRHSCVLGSQPKVPSGDAHITSPRDGQGPMVGCSCYGVKPGVTLVVIDQASGNYALSGQVAKV